MLENINFTEDQLAAMSLLLKHLTHQINRSVSLENVKQVLSEVSSSIEKTKSLCRLNAIDLKWQLNNDHKPLVAGGSSISTISANNDLSIFEEYFIILDLFNGKYEVFVAGTKKFKEISIEVSSFSEACETVLLEYARRKNVSLESLSDWSFSDEAVNHAFEIIEWATKNGLKVVDFSIDVLGGLAIHLKGNNELTCWIAILNSYNGPIRAVTSVISTGEHVISHGPFDLSTDKQNILQVLQS